MFQGSDYIFAIQTKDYKFWKIADDKVTVNAQPYFLDFAPAGWLDIAVQNIRNKRYWGIDRSVTLPLNYVMDGGRILKYIFLNKGIEEPVFISILEQQLVFEPAINATLEFTTGQSPFTPNATATGTITGTPGDTAYVKLTLNNPMRVDDSLAGNFDAFNFVFTGFSGLTLTPTIVYPLVIPVGGVINFSIYFDQTGSNSNVASMELVNANGNTPGYGYWYKQRYRGEIDLSSYSHEGTNVKVATLEDGLPKYLKANENTTIELAMDALEKVKMDGVVLTNTVENLVTDGVTSDPIYDFGNHLVDLVITKEDAPYVQGKKSVARTKVNNINADIHATGGWFANTNVAGTLEFEYDFNIKTTFYPPPGIEPGGRYRVVVRRLNSSGSFVDHFVLLNIPANQITGITRRLTGSGSLAANPGDEFYLYTFFDVTGVGGDAQIQTTYDGDGNSFFNYKYKYRAPTTYIPFFRPQYLLERFIQTVTEGNYSAAISDFFTTHSNKVFTCGNALRGFADAVFKWSFDGFFQFWDCFSSVGITETAGKVDLAQKQDLIDHSSIIDLAEPSDLKVSVATDFLFNELEAGYPEIKNDLGILNGNEAFNTKYLYSMGLMKKPARLDKVSKIAADPYVIEQVRVSTLNKDTTDYKADNDIFPLVINNTLIPGSGDIPDHFELDRSLNASATGLLEKDSVFNIALSPHLNFKRNGPYYRSCFWLCDYKTLKYQSSDKNNKLSFTDPLYGAIVEKADENLGGLGDQFFVPILFDITVPAPTDLVSLLDANPLQVYRFPFYGNYYKGILMKVSTGLASNKAQQWQLLSTADNDLTKLEDYYG